MKIISLAVVFFSANALAAPQLLKSEGGKVEFQAIGKPAFIKIHGNGAAPTGEVTIDGEKATGKFAFSVSSLDTGMDVRNEHMKKKYLEVDKFPNATLDLQSAAKVGDYHKDKAKISDADFTGSLTLHGVSQPVSGKFNIADGGKAEVKFSIKLSQYNITIPTYAGITVADQVEITVDIDKLQ